MTALDCACKRIHTVIAASPVPEDPAHAENTRQWLLRFAPRADTALQIAALAHDIDRAMPNKIQRHHFSDYDTFKAAHAKHGAVATRAILEESAIDPAIIRETCRLICLHETGGDPRADVLRDADSVSYFDVNLPLYFEREGQQEALRRCVWGVRRISSSRRNILNTLQHDSPILMQMIQEALSEME